MIESRFWREQLRADVGWLRRHRRFKRWSERQQVLFEHRLMMVGFQIRVLLDRPKVDGKARRASIIAQVYPKVGTDPVTLLNAVGVEEHFDLAKPTAVTLPVREVCNQLIHHYVMFAVGRSAGGFEVVLVFSDYKRHVGMYELQVRELIELFAVFASDSSHAHHVRMTWNEKKQDYEFHTDGGSPTLSLGHLTGS